MTLEVLTGALGADPTPAGARTHTSPRQHVFEAQRMRILSAMVDLAGENGAQDLAVADVISWAGVSRRTFYNLFDDRNDCALAAIEWAVSLAADRVALATAGHRQWAARVRAGLCALLQFADEERPLARLCVLGSANSGSKALAVRREVLARLAGAIDEGRTPGRCAPPPLTSEGVVGGVLTVIHNRLLDPSEERLTPLLGPLMSMIVLPYLGSAAARRELAGRRPEVPPTAFKPTSEPSPFEDLNVRLTYRTLAVLKAIAANPGLSNKEIGEQAGVTDAGQISRLLWRLAERRLMENTGGGQRLGTTNAWRLTPRGHEVEKALGRETLALVDDVRDLGRTA